MLHIPVIRQNGTNSKLIATEWFSKRTMSLYSANVREDERRGKNTTEIFELCLFIACLGPLILSSKNFFFFRYLLAMKMA